MSSGRLRIIGGCWRGRRLAFPAVAGLRPTPDRVRETLFNWLAATLPGARCLDLYAGSGALGLEALSRGAAAVTFVEKTGVAARALARHLQELGAEEAGRVVRADVLAFLRRPAEPYDIVFLDPPYGRGLVAPTCAALEEGGWLAPGAWIYLERREDDPEPAVPDTWHPHRQTRAGQVRAHLYRRP